MLRQRIITASVLAPLVIFAILWFPTIVITVIVTAMIVAGAWEWSAFPGFASVSARLGYVAIVAAGVAAMWLLGPASEHLDWVLRAAFFWWLLALAWVKYFPAKVNRFSASLAGCLVLLPTWLALVRLHAQPQPAGEQLLVFVLLLVMAADIGAYFVGRRFGRHQLAPKVSPGKTWEGALGGLAAAGTAAGIAVLWFKFSAVSFISLCVMVALASIVGDLTESLFKRHAGLKDSGTLLPGHGGILDRVDSVTAAAPMFLLGLERLGIFR